MPVGYKPEKILPAHNRRVIFVLPGDKIEQIRNDKDYKKLKQSVERNRQTWLLDNAIEKHQDQDTIEFLKKLANDNLLDDGNILIQSSEDDKRYFLAQQVENKVVLPKWDNYMTICNYLGASSIELDITDVTNFGEENNVVIKASSLIANLAARGKFSKKKSIELKDRAKLILEKGSPNLKNVGDFVEKHSLEKDSDIQFIINNRKYNKDFSFNRNINLFTQVEESMNVLSNLVIPDKFINIETSFTRKIKQTKKYNVNVKLDFF